MVRLSPTKMTLQPVTLEQRQTIRANVQTMINRRIEMGRANSSLRIGGNAGVQGQGQIQGRVQGQGQGQGQGNILPNPGGIIPPRGPTGQLPLPPNPPLVPPGQSKKDK